MICFSTDDMPDQVVLKDKDPKVYKAKRERLYGDERFARPGTVCNQSVFLFFSFCSYTQQMDNS